MKRKLTCFCENSFDVDVPEEINLDSDRKYLEEIQNGTFMNFACTKCGKKLKPEFLISVLWPSKNFFFEVFPDMERGDFYRRKKTKEEKGAPKLETIIGYPELADRLAVIRDGYNPVIVEAIKYYLYLKAEEQYPDDEIAVWYFAAAQNGSSLEFHIHGIRKDEVAVMKVPFSLYEKTLADYKKNPKGEVFEALRVRSYLSVSNTMRHEALK